jgi:hypothetical protein
METERFVDAPGAAIDYSRTSARAQYVNPEDDQELFAILIICAAAAFRSYFCKQRCHPTRSGPRSRQSFQLRRCLQQDPCLANSSSEAVWSFGIGLGGQRRFRDPSPQSYAFFFSPSASYVISEEWNVSFSLPITRRWFDMLNDVRQRSLTLEPTAVLEYVIPSRMLGGTNAARMLGNPAIDLVAGVERNSSNLSPATYTQWFTGLVLKTGWRL